MCLEQDVQLRAVTDGHLHCLLSKLVPVLTTPNIDPVRPNLKRSDGGEHALQGLVGTSDSLPTITTTLPRLDTP